MRPWLQDKDGDGIYAIITTKIPAGTWEFKVAHGLSFDESYPADNVSVTVPADGASRTSVYSGATAAVTVTSEVRVPTSTNRSLGVHGWPSPQ